MYTVGIYCKSCTEETNITYIHKNVLCRTTQPLLYLFASLSKLLLPCHAFSLQQLTTKTTTTENQKLVFVKRVRNFCDLLRAFFLLFLFSSYIQIYS